MHTLCGICAVVYFVLLHVARLEFVYHDAVMLENYLRDTVAQYPNITHLYSIGKSVLGRNLWVLALGSNPTQHTLLQPELKYVGNMHGNEVVGREVLVHLIDNLVSRYGYDPEVTSLLGTSRVHILVSLNPDGFETALKDEKEGLCDGVYGRNNANGYDLNRNFPDYYDDDPGPIQPETQAVIDWLDTEQFVLSANLHGGSLVANYPYDNYAADSMNKRPKYSISPDDDVFISLAKTYSHAHSTMSQGLPCLDDTNGFQEGITNGAEWYPITGGMQDYNYIFHGCLELTLEIGCCKFPPASDLEMYWNQNEQALLKWLQQGHLGVKGIVSDQNGHPVGGAQVQVNARQHGTKTTTSGEYWRILLPGQYQIQVKAEGYYSVETSVTVVDGSPTIFNITLKHDPDAAGTAGQPRLCILLLSLCTCLYTILYPWSRW